MPSVIAAITDPLFLLSTLLLICQSNDTTNWSYVVIHCFDLPIFQFHRDIGLLCNATIMGDDNNGLSLFGELLQQLNDKFSIARVQIACWLVCQDYFRVVG